NYNNQYKNRYARQAPRLPAVPAYSQAASPSINITNIYPSTASHGETVVISGTGFGQYKEDVSVTVDGRNGQVLNAEPHRIQCVLPEDGSPGSVELFVTVRGNKSTPTRITIKPDQKPQITGMSIISGPPGQSMQINGNHFSSKISDNKVYFGGVSAPI